MCGEHEIARITAYKTSKKVRFSRFFKNRDLAINTEINTDWFFELSKIAQKVRKTTVFVVKTVVFYGCGGRTRTYDLRVMSPTSFQLLYSAIWGNP